MWIANTFWRVSRRGITLNEGGYFLTFSWFWREGFVRLWFQPFGGRHFLIVKRGKL